MSTMKPVIDADGHVFEIDESWETYADPAYGDRWPRLITDSSGRQIYFFEGRHSHTGREVGPPEGTSAARVRLKSSRASAGHGDPGHTHRCALSRILLASLRVDRRS